MKLNKKFAWIGLVILALLITLIASTATLDTYPYQFLKDGNLHDTVFVIGESAASSDVIGAMKIVAALQTEAVTSTVLPTETIIPPFVTEGTRIGSAGNFNYGESIRDVHKGIFDNEELPKIMGDVTFRFGGKDYKGKQRLQFGETIGRFEFRTSDDGLRNDFLTLQENEKVYEYTLEFMKQIPFDKADITGDFKGKKISIQGVEYTITNAKGAGGTLNELHLALKDTVANLIEGQPFPYASHTITVEGVDTTQTRCILDVDGKKGSIRLDKTDTLAGLTIKVVDVIARHRVGKRDICELSLGEKGIVLGNGQAVSVNGVKMQGSRVEFSGEAGGWSGFTITYTAGDERMPPNNDDIFLQKGDAWVDPLFGNWKIIFADVSAKYEELRFKSTGEEASLVYTTLDGKNVKVPFHYSESTNQVNLGNRNKNLLLPGETHQAAPEKVQLLYTKSDGNTRVLEITNTVCSGSNSKITIVDKTTGNVLANARKLVNACDGTSEVVSLGSFGSIQLVIAPDSVEYVNNAGNGQSLTRYKSEITVTKDTIKFFEKRGKNTLASTISWSVVWNSARQQLEVLQITKDGIPISWVTEKGSDTNMAVTPKGTKISSTATKIELLTPESDAGADVFVAPLTATIRTSASDVLTTVNPFEIGFAVLDSEAASMTKNMIVVGGPCANSIAAEVMNRPFAPFTDLACARDFRSGEALIKIFQRKGKTVLLVAGYSAEDTLLAADVIAQHKDFVLSGNDVRVSRGANGEISIMYKS